MGAVRSYGCEDFDGGDGSWGRRRGVSLGPTTGREPMPDDQVPGVFHFLSVARRTGYAAAPPESVTAGAADVDPIDLQSRLQSIIETSC